MLYVLFALLFVIIIVVPAIVTSFLRNVDAGTIRMVTRLGGSTVVYRGPGKSMEVPLLTTGTTLSCKAINVDLDITDQTADLDEHGVPAPIKVRVLASAIVSVGDSDVMIKTAANRFFSKPVVEQSNMLVDLLSSSGRRAINLLTHDQLFSAKSAPRPVTAAAPPPGVNPTRIAAQAAEEDDDPLAIIIRKACSRELTELGLGFNSLNIKVVMSEVAEARRRMSAAEAQASADIVSAQQARRAKEAQLEAERAISDAQRGLEQTKSGNAALVAEAEIRKHQAQEIAEAKRREAESEAKANADIVGAEQQRRARQAQIVAEQAISNTQRELEEIKANNAALVAAAEAKRQDALALQREAELRATMIAQANAEAEKLKIAELAKAQAEAIRIEQLATANAEAIRKVNEAIIAGGDAYLRYRQVEMMPQLAPYIANALAQAKMVTITSDGGTAGGSTAHQISDVIQTVLAAQIVAKQGLLDNVTPAPAAAPAAPKAG